MKASVIALDIHKPFTTGSVTIPVLKGLSMEIYPGEMTLNNSYLDRGPLELEFFQCQNSIRRRAEFGACIRRDDLDSLYNAFLAGNLSDNYPSMPRLTPQQTDESLIRCIDNHIHAIGRMP